MLDEAIQTAQTTDEKYYEAEFYRQRGEILLSMGRKRDGEAALEQALTIARTQEARWWELRAATDLAEHLCDEGRLAEADDLLRPIHAWFVEGLDTSLDLKRAKALLDRLTPFKTENRAVRKESSSRAMRSAGYPPPAIEAG